MSAATLSSRRATCCRQVPRGDWQHRPEGPHPQQVRSSWVTPAPTHPISVHQSFSETGELPFRVVDAQFVLWTSGAQIFTTREGMIQYHENEGPWSSKDSCSKFIVLIVSHMGLSEKWVGLHVINYNNSDAPDFWTNPHPFPKVLALHPPEGC